MPVAPSYTTPGDSAATVPDAAFAAMTGSQTSSHMGTGQQAATSRTGSRALLLLRAHLGNVA
ncbi:MAG: hypothetical protein JWN08_662 [Frankiales bacterium]|nr:hypothetical protein [Frankiales bacterium]